MKFYTYTAEIENIKALNNSEENETEKVQFFGKSVKYIEGLSVGYFLANVYETTATAVAFFKDSIANAEELKIPFEEIGAVKSVVASEITSKQFANLVNEAETNGYITSARNLIMRLRVTSIFSQQEGFLSENAGYFEDCATSNNRNSVEENLRKSLWLKPFQSELNRIYTPQKISKFVGHPVHYLLSGNDYNNRSNAVKELVAALYQNNRVSSKRYCEISLSNFDVSDLRRISKLYDCYSGGTIVIRYRKNACSDGGVADVGIEVIEDFCKQIMKHKNDVLTVLCFPRFCDVEKEMFFEYLSMLSFVKLEEGSAKFEDAKNYLLSKAQEDEITLSDEFFSGIDAEKSYTLQELDDAYERYSNNYLKTELFPQYKDISSVNKNQLEEKIQSNSYEKLQKMIGLSEAKRVIDSIINYAKMQKAFKGEKRFLQGPSLHMCFTGNPGSAKTTVARILAEILRDNKCLSRGHLIECGRADLVGKYVGHTAQQVKHKFMEAMGGVLFIDEAYSLLDDRRGSYGDEAINTIVQEMENHRDDLIVIFAGYPDKMEDFINNNPGLRSRIAFHVPFEDYNAEELYSITELMAKDKELILADDVKPKLLNAFEKMSKEDSFGNGRYVRSLLEKATMAQASRLVSDGFDSINKKSLSLLTAEDFVIEKETTNSNSQRKIGFC